MTRRDVAKSEISDKIRLGVSLALLAISIDLRCDGLLYFGTIFFCARELLL